MRGPPARHLTDVRRLDTYFVAVGDKPWRCYTAGTPEPAGIFAGYDFTPLGTRSIPLGAVFSELDHSPGIVWLTRTSRVREAASTRSARARSRSPMRALTDPGRPDSLAVWVAQGGNSG